METKKRKTKKKKKRKKKEEQKKNRVATEAATLHRSKLGLDCFVLI